MASILSAWKCSEARTSWPPAAPMIITRSGGGAEHRERVGPGVAVEVVEVAVEARRRRRPRA
jgi:hypothetical protein